MKLFTKLALVSAVAVSSNAMALQAMDDAALSATTGQDGISIGIGISKVDIDKVHVFDGDGLSATAKLSDGVNGATDGTPILGGTAKAGAITINNVVLTANTASLLSSHNLADITIDTDGNGGSPFLNIGAAVSGLNISLGKIEVNDVDATTTNSPYKVGTGTATILNGLTLTTGKTAANIQLGNTPQGAMIKLAGSMTGGLTISNLSLHDASAGGGGDIVLGSIKLTDTGSANLSTDAAIAVRAAGVNGATADGLQITAMTKPTDIYIQKIQLGSSSAASIGDVAISGLKVYNGTAGTTPGAVITIAGH
ncbi:DUF6160 family protein [Acinetobacter nematophilus]|uniref:putative pilus system protein FilA n=1 Tax=Acinetobacter nematophilus TaxID=2994642 RepID=UPI003AF95668